MDGEVKDLGDDENLYADYDHDRGCYIVSTEDGEPKGIIKSVVLPVQAVEIPKALLPLMPVGGIIDTIFMMLAMVSWIVGIFAGTDWWGLTGLCLWIAYFTKGGRYS